jgi:UTP-glucose-1-phosphate uridylyltransferase
MPKEIMTLVDRPLVQYAIDKAPELERSLRNKGKAKLLSVLWF